MGIPALFGSFCIRSLSFAVVCFRESNIAIWNLNEIHVCIGMILTYCLVNMKRIHFTGFVTMLGQNQNNCLYLLVLNDH